jgi:hypothetical protein
MFLSVFIIQLFKSRKWIFVTKFFSLVLIISCILCFISGILMIPNWGNPFSNASPQLIGRIAAHRRGWLILLVVRFWPYMLIVFSSLFSFLGVTIFFEKTSNRNKDISNKTIAKSFNTIINAYGTAVQNQVEKNVYVSDSSTLPYPKKIIKLTIIYGIKQTNDEKTREYLRGGYLQLSNWLDGVGEEVQDVEIPKISLDASSDDQKIFVKELHESLSSIDGWDLKKLNELEKLKNELCELGLW